MNIKFDSKETCAAKKLKKKSGFTLLETVIAVALVSIFFTAAAMLIPMWYKSYTRIINVNYARQIADNMMGAVEQQIRFANHVKVIEPTAEDAVKRITGKYRMVRFTIPMEDSSNFVDGFVYDDKFFIHNDVKMDFEISDDYSYCMVTIKVFRDGEQILTKSRAVALAGEN